MNSFYVLLLLTVPLIQCSSGQHSPERPGALESRTAYADTIELQSERALAYTRVEGKDGTNVEVELLYSDGDESYVLSKYGVETSKGDPFSENQAGIMNALGRLLDDHDAYFTTVHSYESGSGNPSWIRHYAKANGALLDSSILVSYHQPSGVALLLDWNYERFYLRNLNSNVVNDIPATLMCSMDSLHERHGPNCHLRDVLSIAAVESDLAHLRLDHWTGRSSHLEVPIQTGEWTKMIPEQWLDPGTFSLKYPRIADFDGNGIPDTARFHHASRLTGITISMNGTRIDSIGLDGTYTVADIHDANPHAYMGFTCWWIEAGPSIQTYTVWDGVDLNDRQVRAEGDALVLGMEGGETTLIWDGTKWVWLHSGC